MATCACQYGIISLCMCIYIYIFRRLYLLAVYMIVKFVYYHSYDHAHIDIATVTRLEENNLYAKFTAVSK